MNKNVVTTLRVCLGLDNVNSHPNLWNYIYYLTVLTTIRFSSQPKPVFFSRILLQEQHWWRRNNGNSEVPKKRHAPFTTDWLCFCIRDCITVIFIPVKDGWFIVQCKHLMRPNEYGEDKMKAQSTQLKFTELIMCSLRPACHNLIRISWGTWHHKNSVGNNCNNSID